MVDRTDIYRKYENKWVALSNDDRVISSGSSLEEVLSKARAEGVDDPFTTKIPSLKYDYLL